MERGHKGFPVKVYLYTYLYNAYMSIKTLMMAKKKIFISMNFEPTNIRWDNLKTLFLCHSNSRSFSLL